MRFAVDCFTRFVDLTVAQFEIWLTFSQFWNFDIDTMNIICYPIDLYHLQNRLIYLSYILDIIVSYFISE